MRPIFLSIVTIVFSAHTSYADKIVIRSGEHDGFTRLVADVALPTKWTIIELSKRQYEISILDKNAKLDTSQVFDRISKNRVAKLSNNGESGLVIELNCDCKILAYEYDQKMIIFDVIEAQNSATLTPNEITSGGTYSVNFFDPNYGRSQVRYAKTTEKYHVPFNIQNDPVGPNSFLSRKPVEDAITSGLLEASEAKPAFPNAQLFNPSINNNNKDRSELIESAQKRNVDANLRIQNEQNLRLENYETGCIEDMKVDLRAWRVNLTSDQTMVRMGEILAKADTFDDEVIEVIQSLIAYGLGTEARALAKETSVQIPEYLESISYSIEGVENNSPAMNEYIDCDSDMAFWAYLGTSSKNGELSLTAGQKTKSLESLPKDVRGNIQRLLEARMRQPSDIDNVPVVGVLDSSAQSPFLGNRSTTTNIEGTAPVARPSDDTEHLYLENLKKKIAEYTRILQRLSQNPDGRSQTLGILTLESLSVEYEGTLYEGPIQAAITLSLSDLGRYREAMENLTNTGIEYPYRTTLGSIVVLDITKRANNLDFLRVVTSSKNQNIFFDLDPVVQDAMLRRLNSLGYQRAGGTINSAARNPQRRPLQVKEASGHLNSEKISDHTNRITNFDHFESIVENIDRVKGDVRQLLLD